MCEYKESRVLDDCGACVGRRKGEGYRVGAAVAVAAAEGWIVYGVHVPFETPLRWIIQIGLSTDFRYMMCRVRGTHRLYAMPSCWPAALHLPHTPTLPPLLLPQVQRFPAVLVLLLPGDQPNSIVDSRLYSTGTNLIHVQALSLSLSLTLSLSRVFFAFSLFAFLDRSPPFSGGRGLLSAPRWSRPLRSR